MTWSSVRLPATDGELSLSLPPGWWTLRPAGPGLDAQIAAVVDAQTEGLPSYVATELTAEFDRMSRAATLSGAVLLAGGAARGDDDGRIVVASLLLAPYDRYGQPDRPQWSAGPVDRLAVPTGVAVRHTWLGTCASPVGRLRQLDVEYVVAPPAPPTWVLAFRTPALAHAPMLLRTFDAIAGTLAVDGSHEPALPFG
jgi:hypothetical protein